MMPGFEVASVTTLPGVAQGVMQARAMTSIPDASLDTPGWCPASGICDRITSAATGPTGSRLPLASGAVFGWPGPASYATAIASSADAREPKGSGSRSVPAVRSANGASSSKSRPGERTGTALGWADAVLASVMMGDGGAGGGSGDGDRDPAPPAATAGVAEREELGAGAGSGGAGAQQLSWE